jgi:uncharacterized protein (DUF1015 family)
VCHRRFSVFPIPAIHPIVETLIVPTISPFRGLRYNSEVISSISRVVAPPYDVIDPDDEQAFRARDPHNVVHLTMGKVPSEGRRERDYVRAAATLNRWQKESVVAMDEEPGIYVVEQSFRLEGQWLLRRGFISALLLEELGQEVHPHEHTLSSPKDDRFRLTQACETKLSQIMTIYSDPEGEIDALVHTMRSGEPLHSFTDDDGVAYRFWPVSDLEAIQELARRVGQEKMVIADGHHRYESSLSFARAHRDSSRSWGDAPEDYIAALCISVANPGLISLPTHRRVQTDEPFEEKKVLDEIQRNFDVTDLGQVTANSAQEEFDHARRHTNLIGCLLPDRRLLLLQPRQPEQLRRRFPAEADSWWNLPVCLLHHVLFPDLINLSPDAGADSEKVDFRHRAEEIYTGVVQGDFDIGFLLPPTDPAAVQRVAATGQRLPQKSTYFYPKVASGLVFYPHSNKTLSSIRS